MPLRLLGWLLMCLSATALPAAGQAFQSATDLVDWRAEVPAVEQGGEAYLELTAAIAPGWKMYAPDSPPPSRGIRVTSVEGPERVVAGELEFAPPRQGYDPNFGIDVRYYADRAELYVPLAVGAGVDPDTYEMAASVQFMICNDRMCLPPTTVAVPAVLTVEAAPVRAPAMSEEEGKTGAPRTAADAPRETPRALEPERAPGGDDEGAEPGTSASASEIDTARAAVAAPQPDEPSTPTLNADPAPEAVVADFEASRAGGLWGFLLLAIGAGLASLLMPCVFPMIPLTVSYFTKHAEDRAQALRMALVYGGAIVLTFTGLGILMAFLVGAAGAQTIAANPWINLFIGLVFVVFALSLLGLFELRLPSGLVNYFNRQSTTQSGYAGVLFMGFTLTLVSFSCTAPFVGGLLAATAVGEWTYPIFGMLAYSATFALPFFGFALFPRALSSLPKSGAWMTTVKVVLGFVELAAALKFLSNADLVWGWNVLSRPLAIALTAVIFFLTGLFLIGKLRLAHSAATEEIGVGRLIVAIGFFGLSLYVLPGLFGAPLNALDAYLPPRQAGDVSLIGSVQPGATSAAHDDEAWFTDDIEGAFAAAEASGKPLFIDFTGYTCTNCRQMEANVFPQPAVAARFDRDFVLLRLYTDDLERGEEFQRFQLRLTGTVALPTYAIVSPRERTLLRKTSGLVPVERFVAFLDDGHSMFEQRALAARD